MSFEIVEKEGVAIEDIPDETVEVKTAGEAKQKNIFQKLCNIQQSLNVPKDQYNKFGKYTYRSAESILGALKPLLAREKLIILFDDQLVQIGDRYYLNTTARLVDPTTGEEVETSGWAREEEQKTGMNGSQITGASSSYARKYALNAMFAIDDVKDSDATNNGPQKQAQSQMRPQAPAQNQQTPTQSQQAQASNQ